ncbi:MAG: TonB-dependent receptor [Bryobacteraceae bacterium]|nr:TonB-dependent receptor [Bryobacteraceae bacterium]
MQRIASLLLLASIFTFAQSDRGTLTGTITDQTGAVVPNALVTITNPATGTQLKTVSTETGNYTAPNLAAGLYDITVELQGFRKHEQKGVRVQVAQISRLDVELTVGSTAESVSVSADVPLLKTESASQATTIGRDQINQLPLNFALGAGAIRNPLSFVQLSPGASISGWNNIRVNGAPAGTFKIIFEGQDSTSSLDARVSDELQPSVESLEEFTLQSSNFSAEFGQVGGGLFNFTSRSGTNEFHGSVYDYFVNEFLNAGVPFTSDGKGNLLRPRSRRQDWGFSVGGPVDIPKVYSGKNRTFFFWNYERFVDKQNQFLGYGTVPTESYRRGDFSAAITGRNLGTDGLGRPILENTVYDPNTARTVDGRIYRDPFPNNVIPQGRIDPVSLKIQNLMPAPFSSALINNWERRTPYRKIQDIPSVKIDHSFTSTAKMSGYYSMMRTDKDVGQDGLPDPISARRDLTIRSHSIRLNYDQSLSPTLLLHLGAGYQHYRNPDSSPVANMEYDAEKELGLKGGFTKGFPRITDLGTAQGGLGVNMGPTNRNIYYTEKVTGQASVSWIRSSHSFKFGGEYTLDAFTNRNSNTAPGVYGFNASQTGLPALQGVALPGGNVGFPYASFLLGMANSASVSNPQDPQYRKWAFAAFVQDTWRVNRKLTLDIGLRYDYQPAPREIWYRTSMFAPTIPNPSAGGLPGATLYAGYGQGRCNCWPVNTYALALGPRLGAAYQVNPKTVLRAGFAISYGQVTQFRYIGGGNSLGMGFNSIAFSTPAFGDPAVLMRNGLSYNPAELLAASYDPGIRPLPNQINSPPALVDPNAGRPPRVANWNIALQRELTKDLSIEAAYVANRGAWFRADGLNDYNGVTAERLKNFGLDISRADHRALLTSRIDSPQVVAAGFKKPYTSFPGSATLAQSLRPYPQFAGLTSLWAPLGNNWYDSLQVKATKRYSRGLDFTAAYTWSKTLTTVEDMTGATVPLNDVYNRRNQKTYSISDQPHVFVIGINYLTPLWNKNTLTRWALSGWTIGGIFRYSSGFPIRVPAANNNLGSLLFRSTYANRVPGEPLYLKDLNARDTIDPFKDLVLNPKAWADPAPGEWGTSAVYYGDYRTARRPDEQFSFGKLFRIKERMSFSLRAEFFNVFNRTYLMNPESGNAQATPRYDAAGNLISGFGRINPGSVYNPPRSGQLVARFQF